MKYQRSLTPIAVSLIAFSIVAGLVYGDTCQIKEIFCIAASGAERFLGTLLYLIYAALVVVAAGSLIVFVPLSIFAALRSTVKLVVRSM